MQFLSTVSGKEISFFVYWEILTYKKKRKITETLTGFFCFCKKIIYFLNPGKSAKISHPWIFYWEIIASKPYTGKFSKPFFYHLGGGPPGVPAVLYWSPNCPDGVGAVIWLLLSLPGLWVAGLLGTNGGRGFDGCASVMQTLCSG